jgi:ferredoxin
MKVKLDRGLCIWVGNCVVAAPKVFKLDQQNKAVAADASSVDEGSPLGRGPELSRERHHY